MFRRLNIWFQTKSTTNFSTNFDFSLSNLSKCSIMMFSKLDKKNIIIFISISNKICTNWFNEFCFFISEFVKMQCLNVFKTCRKKKQNYAIFCSRNFIFDACFKIENDTTRFRFFVDEFNEIYRYDVFSVRQWKTIKTQNDSFFDWFVFFFNILVNITLFDKFHYFCLCIKLTSFRFVMKSYVLTFIVSIFLQRYNEIANIDLIEKNSNMIQRKHVKNLNENNDQSEMHRKNSR